MKNEKSNYKIKTIVLRSKIGKDEIKEYVERKKTSAFSSLLRSPERSEIHVHSLKLIYEPFLILSGSYNSDFYQKTTHTITVPSNVTEVILGDGVFPVRKKSKFIKKLNPRSKNKTDIEFEEHVFLEDKKQLVLDHHGKERSFKYKIDSKNQENYPDAILNHNEIRNPEITIEAAVEKLTKKLRHSLETDVRDLREDIRIDEIHEIYLPIYEARLIGPKKKVKLMRIDGDSKTEELEISVMPEVVGKKK